MFKISGREQCEAIAATRYLTKKDGTNPPWEEIWRYSSTGELVNIPFWFEEAITTHYLMGRDFFIFKNPHKIKRFAQYFVAKQLFIGKHHLAYTTMALCDEDKMKKFRAEQRLQRRCSKKENNNNAKIHNI